MIRFTLALLLATALAPHAQGSYAWEDLTENQSVAGFRVLNLYENAADEPMGARFMDERSGFIVDYLQIQSVPQAFFWIKTPPTSSMGEPHACEHLLLGKGKRGRYVATLEDMSLTTSTAYTGLTHTCYHFNTTAGEATFYRIFEEKLEALLNPDFTDEEIRREVCHIGVTENSSNGTLAIEEKGSVYTEMVSVYEKPWSHFIDPINTLLYGAGHPLSHDSGGNPDSMRAMVPEDLRRFHQRTHHLANMGTILALPEEIAVPTMLGELGRILRRCQPEARRTRTVGMSAFAFPPAHPAPSGTIQITTYPSEDPEDAGYLLLAWPADVALSQSERLLYELFIDAFAGGETSTVYDLFLNSATRRMTIGGSGLWCGLDSDMGNAFYIGLTGLDRRVVTEASIDSIRTHILSALQTLRDSPRDAPELQSFNARVLDRLLETRREISSYLNTPPSFGARRGPAGRWLELLKVLEGEGAFRKSLLRKSHFAYVEDLLAREENIWSEWIDRWGLLVSPPYAVATGPSAEMLAANAAAKTARIEGYLVNLEARYGITDEQDAIAAFKREFDAKTEELEAFAAAEEIPGFIANPPLTLDDQLRYETFSLPGGIPLCTATFENMTTGMLGLALRLDVIPEPLLMYVSLLPTILTGSGIIEAGQALSYEEMRARLRREILSLEASFAHGYRTGRTELILEGRGSNPAEFLHALRWMDAVLWSPNLQVANLPRLRDIADQSLRSYRNVMTGSEEDWVNYPVDAYRFQTDPLFLSTNCFLTEVHHAQRLKWQLTDPGTARDQNALVDFLRTLARIGSRETHDALSALLTDLAEGTAGDRAAELAASYESLTDIARTNARAIVAELRATLPDIPPASLARDWAYLCEEIESDLLVVPEDALRAIQTVLGMIRAAGNARCYMVSNSADRSAVWDALQTIAGRLALQTAPPRREYADDLRIVARLKEREPGIAHPTFVGLVHPDTRNGVISFTTQSAAPYDTSTEALLTCLAGKLYGGGGTHGLFMKTWAAGLAYSNGYGYGEGSGRISYYAERCPDVAETMRFVVQTLKEAPGDPQLCDYAIAQVFSYSRAPARYESRGRAMAADLTDGFGPERVRAFREKVLALRDRPDLYEALRAHMPAAYGPVLIGYGEPVAQTAGTNVLIGPEAQFRSLEEYIATAEFPQPVYRLYPRDYWLRAN